MLTTYDKTTEQKWQSYWEKEGIHTFDENSKKEVYSIDTPPPFTSGELHMGHVLSYSYFDFVARYKRMNGFNVYYPQGWDTQGFPTEVAVEKKYGKLPPEQFRQKCIEWTLEMIKRMKEQMIQMGWSPDWKHEYITMQPDYHRKVQQSLVEMYNKKLIYRAEYPVYWCPHCVSAVAKAELDDLERDGVINDIIFRGPNNEELIVATTRPELMPACVAMAFNPNDERYKYLKGKKGKSALGKEVPIFADENVDPKFGTGLIQICPYGDAMDLVWVNRYKLKTIDTIDKYGKMQNTGEFDGLKVVEARKKIIEKLEKEGKVVKKTPLKQVVKVHDRCKTVVELIPSKQWFADIRTTAKQIKDLANQVKWVPEFGISYLIDWVESAEWDWVISRQRVFGTPLPFYYCEKCNKTKAAEIKDLPFYAEKAAKKKCDCGEELKAETSTCDCWIDSSITPLIIAGWPDDNKRFEKLYPISLRPQGVEIVRTWAFYTIYRSGVGLTGKKPWDTILLNGNVLAPDGKKMSKSLGNVISPKELQKDYPTDAIRQWAAMSGAMAKDRPFSHEDIKRAKAFLLKLWNAAKFVETSTTEFKGNPVIKRKVDIWIISRMNQEIKEVTEAMEKFEFHNACGRLQHLFWNEFCDHYIEYVKYRIYQNIDKEQAQYCLRYVLENTIKLLSPIAPHVCEEIYSEMFEKKSLQKTGWPKAGEINQDVVTKMHYFKELVSEIRKYKSNKQISQAAELQEYTLDKIRDKSIIDDKEQIEELKMICKIKEINTGKERSTWAKSTNA